MLDDASSIPSGSSLKTDVCIVGAGPAGITMALELAAAGIEVLLLESGGTTRERGPSRLNRASSVGYPMTVTRTRSRGVGGSSLAWLTLNSLRARPLDEIDLESRAELPHSGWPFDRTHLDPYYARAHAWAGMGPYRYDLDDWTEPDARPLSLNGRDVETTLFQFGPSDQWQTYVERLRASPNIMMVTHATVVEIVADAAGCRVSRLRVMAPDRYTFDVQARRFVLAMGGLENPRLLLASTGVHARGIGNQHDVVGRFFMEHLSYDTGKLRPWDQTTLNSLALYNQRHLARGWPVQGMLTVPQKRVREEGLRNATFWVSRSYPRRWKASVISAHAIASAVRRRPLMPGIPQHLRNIASDPIPLLQLLNSTVLKHRPPREFLRFRVLAEQAPNPDSRVTLGRGRDHLGMPRLQVDWRVAEDDVLSIQRHQDILARGLSDSGIGELTNRFADERPAPTLIGNAHPMGTTRMHQDPRQGVVNEDCQVHGVTNLFIAGSSVFPTSGYANPTLTLLALSIRLSDHLRAGGGLTSGAGRSEPSTPELADNSGVESAELERPVPTERTLAGAP